MSTFLLARSDDKLITDIVPFCSRELLMRWRESSLRESRRGKIVGFVWSSSSEVTITHGLTTRLIDLRVMCDLM